MSILKRESNREQDMDTTTANPNQNREIEIEKPNEDAEVPSDDKESSPASKTQNMNENENQNLVSNSGAGESKENKNENHNMASITGVEDSKQDETDSQNKELGQLGMVQSVVNKSPSLRIAVHGMSELINTRLSTEALEICLELIEAGVQPRALAEVVLHILDLKVKKYEKENGPMLP
ncbi:uncharacterized protein Dvir_GJ24068, isoform B [Drosophila virilis]|uniref:Uncharacterized protein, isoform B n=1 Tax=Drosophila virilis TaxID=7244 RepID=A0A0Q9WFA6_DROVI|nr:uncharacterized protein Dvir_GJ24068, isoform B [Drosophila virilis]